MTRKTIYSILSVFLLTVLFLLTPFTRMKLHASIFKNLPPVIVLTSYSKTMDVGDESYLVAVASNGKIPTFRSSKSSVASVNTYGLITAKKAGTCKITAKVKNAEASCKITVRPTTVAILPTSVVLYRKETKQLTVTSSTGHAPEFKSSRSSVATVDEYGKITAIKNGTAKITAKVDGISKYCTVKVKKPTISLSASKLTLTVGSTQRLSASVSSGNAPEWSTSNMNVASVSSNGTITARQKGRAYIYAREDGAKAKCTVIVTDAKK